jgi:hypothetical protein
LEDTLKMVRYLVQKEIWPEEGRHILAQHDEVSIYVYQAYRPAIARFAVEHQRFGGEFSYSRMSWIKPNFLWMMYRSGWATKEGQQHILAIRIRRSFFDELLKAAVPSSLDPTRYASREAWQQALSRLEVRLQWDPDHDPAGRPLRRRAIQLGLRGDMLRRFGEQDLLSVADITAFVAEQRQHLADDLRGLLVPEECVYRPSAGAAAAAAIAVP